MRKASLLAMSLHLTYILLAGATPASTIDGYFVSVVNAQVSPATPSEVPGQACAAGTAVLAWKVNKGTFAGEQLTGLSVVALVCANGQLGVDEKVKTRTSFLVDAQASSAQQAALVAMAKEFAGVTIQEVESIQPVKIDLTVWQGCAIGCASLKADTLNVRTRRLSESEASEASEGNLADSELATLNYRNRAFVAEFDYAGSDFEGKPVQLSNRDYPGAMVGGFWR